MRKAMLLIVVLVALLPTGTSHAQGEGEVNFPELTGPYAVGRVSYHFVDEARAEVYSDDPDDVREVMVTVYYPAEPDAGAVPGEYADAALQDGIQATMGIPAEVLDSIQPHAYEQAPAVQERFPVLIFSHGGGVNPIFYTAMLEEISSHGYVVAAITHPYESSVTVFPDGRQVASYDVGADFYADIWELSDEQRQDLADVPSSQRLATLQSALSEDELNAGMERYYEFVVALHTQDMQSVVDQLSALDEDDPILAGRLDFERLGAFGHSLGGATAANAMHEDSRFKAGIDIDGSLFSAKDYTLEQPFMLILSDNRLTVAQDTSEEARTAITEYCGEMSAFYARLSPGYFFTLAGLTHIGLVSDLALAQTVYPEFLGGLVVGIEPTRAVEMLNTYVWTFFDQYLNGTGSVDDLAADFPEVLVDPKVCIPS
ncbi:MAG TPA: hypothetical protein VHP83_00715 [Aggregatilineaceae bacterium]|nr:hypothetical protein [Aggregatilineaceae bacterium]